MSDYSGDNGQSDNEDQTIRSQSPTLSINLRPATPNRHPVLSRAVSSECVRILPRGTVSRSLSQTSPETKHTNLTAVGVAVGIGSRDLDPTVEVTKLIRRQSRTIPRYAER